MAKDKKNYAEIAHNLTKRHWIWYTLIVSAPTIWFTFVVSVFGKVLHIKNAAGDFTLGGKIISAVVIVLSFVISLMNNRYASKSEFGELEKLRGHVEYLDRITESVDSICDQKATKITRTIYQVKKENKNVPEIISDPRKQLEKILEQIAVCLAAFMKRPQEKYSSKDFTITMAYNFPVENKDWIWLDGTIANLENKSTFNHVRTSNKKYYFNNKKENAKKEDRYMYDSYDVTNEANGKPIGSIFCYNYKIHQGNTTYVDAILTISTKQKRFVNEDDDEKIENARDNIIRLVDENFGRRIKIELGLLYLDSIE